MSDCEIKQNYTEFNDISLEKITSKRKQIIIKLKILLTKKAELFSGGQTHERLVCETDLPLSVTSTTSYYQSSQYKKQLRP